MSFEKPKIGESEEDLADLGPEETEEETEGDKEADAARVEKMAQKEAGKRERGLAELREKLGNAGSGEKPPDDRSLAAGEEEPDDNEISGQELKRLGFGELTHDITRVASFFQEREEERLSPLIAPEEIGKIRSLAHSLESLIEQRKINIDELTATIHNVVEAIGKIGEVRARTMKENEESLSRGISRLRNFSEHANDLAVRVGGENPEDSPERQKITQELRLLMAKAQEKWLYLARKRQAFLEYRGGR